MYFFSRVLNAKIYEGASADDGERPRGGTLEDGTIGSCRDGWTRTDGCADVESGDDATSALLSVYVVQDTFSTPWARSGKAAPV
jgi:hypothetical protein